MPNILDDTFSWIKSDFQENKIRFVAETIAWFLAMAMAITMAWTVPTPPMHLLYPTWITASILFGWAAWTRGSTAMVANYSVMITIDLVGVTRLLLG